MAITSAAIAKAVVGAWSTYGLDWAFKRDWVESDRTEYPSLHDSEAGAAQVMPYCVFRADPNSVITRMSGVEGGPARYETHDTLWMFNVFTRVLAGSGKDAKTMAADLAEAIMGVYGGHPTIVPKQLTLDQGSLLLMEYRNDYGVYVPGADENYQWVVSYNIRADVPQAA